MLFDQLVADLFLSSRLWILRHIAVGYASHLQRLMGLSWKFLGGVVPGYNDHTEAGSDLRGRIFMTCESRTSFCSVSACACACASSSPAVVVFCYLSGYVSCVSSDVSMFLVVLCFLL